MAFGFTWLCIVGRPLGLLPENVQAPRRNRLELRYAFPVAFGPAGSTWRCSAAENAAWRARPLQHGHTSREPPERHPAVPESGRSNRALPDRKAGAPHTSPARVARPHTVLRRG